MITLQTEGVHHIVLTVTDLKRSLDFYTKVLNFKVNAGSIETGRIFLLCGSTVLGIGLPVDPNQMPTFDQFNEHRVGLDHLSIRVESPDVLHHAQLMMDEHHVPHGEIKDLRPYGFPVMVLAFRDPDNIQLELSAPAPM